MTEETREEGFAGRKQGRKRIDRPGLQAVDGCSIYVGNAALYFFNSMSEIR